MYSDNVAKIRQKPKIWAYSYNASTSSFVNGDTDHFSQSILEDCNK